MVNEIKIPHKLYLHQLKPWEMPFVDTKQDWEFGSWGNSARLGHLCDLFGFPSPKDDLAGHKVNEAYWEEREEEIKVYCEKDVLAVANLILRMAGMETL